MKKVKITIAALALVATIGLTSASHATSASAPEDCKLQENQSVLIDQDDCFGSLPDVCCYLVEGNDEIPGEYIP